MKFSQQSLSADDIVIAGISLNNLAEQERPPSLRYVSNHFLFLDCDLQSAYMNRFCDIDHCKDNGLVRHHKGLLRSSLIQAASSSQPSSLRL